MSYLDGISGSAEREEQLLSQLEEEEKKVELLTQELASASRSNTGELRRSVDRLQNQLRNESSRVRMLEEREIVLCISGSLGVQVTPQVILHLPLSTTCDLLLSKLTTVLAVGFGAFTCGTWFVGRVKDILSHLYWLATVLEKGKGKMAEVPDTDANADSDSSEGSSNNARNMTLAQFALVAAMLVVCAKALTVARSECTFIWLFFAQNTEASAPSQ